MGGKLNNLALPLNHLDSPVQRAFSSRTSRCTCLLYTPTPWKIEVPSWTKRNFSFAVILEVPMSKAYPKTCLDLLAPSSALLCFSQRNPDEILRGKPRFSLRVSSFLPASSCIPKTLQHGHSSSFLEKFFSSKVICPPFFCLISLPASNDGLPISPLRFFL